MTATTDEPSGEAARLRERVRDLTWVLDCVTAQRELAVYRSWQAGIPVGDLARLSMLDGDAVERLLADCRSDPDIDSCVEGPDWVRIYPHHGWRVST